MVRPRRIRRIRVMPDITYFKPAGVPMASLSETILSVEEFEAVRLKDLEGMEQSKAAKKMKVSQPTFNRTLSSARKKLAEAIIQGKAIKIQGGNFKMIEPRGKGLGMGRGRGLGVGGGGRMGGPMAAGPGGQCICPKCGHKEPQVRGQPCMGKKCPKCGTAMMRA